MKKINLRGISEILSEKELKNVMGGSGDYSFEACSGKSNNASCGTQGGRCYYEPGGNRLYCWPA